METVMAREAVLASKEIKKIAKEMLAEGSLSTKRLHERCQERGGADYKRCVDIARAVREEATQTAAGTRMLEDPTDGEPVQDTQLPKEIHGAITRALPVIAESIDRIRQEESARARANEDAIRSEHARELEVLRRHAEELQQEMNEIAEDAARFERERDEAQARITELEERTVTLSAERDADRQETKQERERLQTMLQDATTREKSAQEAAQKAALARQESEGAYRTLESAHRGVLDEVAELRQRVEALRGELASAQQERAVATANAEAATARAIRAESREEALFAQLRGSQPTDEPDAPKRRRKGEKAPEGE